MSSDKKPFMELKGYKFYRDGSCVYSIGNDTYVGHWEWENDSLWWRNPFDGSLWRTWTDESFAELYKATTLKEIVSDEL